MFATFGMIGPNLPSPMLSAKLLCLPIPLLLSPLVVLFSRKWLDSELERYLSLDKARLSRKLTYLDLLPLEEERTLFLSKGYSNSPGAPNSNRD